MYLPTTIEEVNQMGWEMLDVILVTGDSYIDNSFIGGAVIGKVLLNAGFRVGIIAQPDVNGNDICRLGEPALFWGVSGGSIDSMVANYTALKKKRHSDDFTPGGKNNRRPDRAVIVYSNLIRRYFKNTKPIVIGGIEASLRRIVHYDYWTDRLRKSILINAKADYLIYGMGESTVLQLADHLKKEIPVTGIRGLCYISKNKIEDSIELPSYEEVLNNKDLFIKMFHLFYRNNDPLNARRLIQKQDTRYIVQNPPSKYLSQQELDNIHDIKFENDLHPYYKKDGDVAALNTIKFSIITHRGCYGECHFCAITVHQGRTVRWRSERSVLKEVDRFVSNPDFKGNILDAGGPTANMYGFECEKKMLSGSCLNKRCIFPKVCSQLRPNHKKQINLLRKMRNIKGVKKVFIASGIRYDLLQHDKKYGYRYLKDVVNHHVSGQLKIAPEHVLDSVLLRMGKPGIHSLEEFRNTFNQLSKRAKKLQFLTYYIIAAHPGCTENEMRELKRYTSSELKINPEQVQIFTPTPSTYSSLMYYTEKDPFTGESIFVEKDLSNKEKQKSIITRKSIYLDKGGNHSVRSNRRKKKR